MTDLEIGTSEPEYQIKVVETPPLSEEYIKFRDELYQKKLEEFQEAGKPLFNGDLYRFMGVEDSNVLLGHMQYADRLVRSELSVEEIERRFGKDYVMKNACVDAIMVTTDRKIVVGVKTRSVDLKQGKLGFVGGNMNADEVKVSSFEDIYTMMSKEIEEETTVVTNREKMSFLRVGVVDTWASFYFLYRLDISSKDVGTIFKDSKDKEFAELITMTSEEIKNTDRVGIGDFNLTKEWIEEVVS